MKDYNRLTEKDSCYYDDMERIDDLGGVDILYDRLADLEDKIESGELCDRKETAREIIDELLKNTLPTFDIAERPIIKVNSDFALNVCKKYGIVWKNKSEDKE